MLPQEIINIEAILSDFLGESKNGINADGQIQYPCPRCIEEKGEEQKEKYNLEVNLFQMVFQCWSCAAADNNMKGSLSKLIKMYGTPYHYKAFQNEVKSLRESQMYNLDLYSGVTFNVESVIEHLSLPQGFKKIDIATCRNYRLLDYLQKRAIDQNTIDKYNIGYVEWEKDNWQYNNRIIIPSYDKFGDLNYFLGRDFTGNSKMKYRNCDNNKKEVIFQESLIDWDAPIYLCEGVFDAIRIPNNGIAMLGKILTNDCALYESLMSKANSEVILVLDGDTTLEEARRIVRLLDHGRLKGKIKYVNINDFTQEYKDLSEIYENLGKKGIYQTLSKQKYFSEFIYG